MKNKKRVKGKKNYERSFSLIEELENGEEEPHLHRHFANAMQEVTELENWMRCKGIKNNWTLTEKLAFIRNVEAQIRTNAAVRRTELSWWAFGLALAAALLGFIVGLNT